MSSFYGPNFEQWEEKCKNQAVRNWPSAKKKQIDDKIAVEIQMRQF